ncbi:MAG: hypothetical protein LBI19_04715 [Oscillospiraceae bacterium]|jgi:hypothetical protein|nr:hypothetical protein [Oscillospiraceae bacterium]
MMTYCQNCGRALSGQTSICLHCQEPVEKNTVQETAPLGQPEAGRGILYWLTNVFWYHYRVHTIVVAFAVLVAAFSIYSAVTREETDFVFIVASEQPVSDMQGEALSGFWAEHVDSVTNLGYSVLYLGEISEQTMAGWQLFQIGMIGEEYSLFIIGESMIGALEENIMIFYTAEELGLPSAGPLPELIPLAGVSVMEELYFTFEPMYALVKRPYYDRGGSFTPDTVARSEMARDCVKALLGS